MKQEKNINKNFTIHKNGFTLLLAVLITSIVLAISSGFSAFVIRELSVSIIGRESQKAVFAADSGIECVLYWDFSQNKFATSSPSLTISCAGSSYTVGGPGGVSTFTLNFTNGACAVVEVNKIIEPYPGTRIDSRGRSTCVTGSANRVERAFRVVY